MKIYFEDGELKPNNVGIKYDYIVDARYGYTKNVCFLNRIRESEDNASVYTNFIAALDNTYGWNDELQVPEIYLLKGNDFIRIDKLTDKELREANNIMKMYAASAFTN